jgi:hypothetical protein
MIEAGIEIDIYATDLKTDEMEPYRQGIFRSGEKHGRNN